MENTENYLECERNRVYYTLIAIAGFFGAYTFLLRGKVFCNAQTGNLVLLGLAIGQAEWETAAYYLFPISAYMAGAFISELLPNPVKYHLKIRWDTLLIAGNRSGAWTCTGIRTGADLTGCGQLYCFYAVQYVSSGRGNADGDNFCDKPYPPGRCGTGKRNPAFSEKR